MKLFSFIGKPKARKSRRGRRNVLDYYQESVNSYGKQQLKSLIDRGLSVQW